MGLTYLGGAISIDSGRVSTAKKTPFLGMYVENWRKAIVLQEQSLADLKLVEDRYDDARGIWFFKVELHDDDLPNAQLAPLEAFLRTMPAQPGCGFVASRESWKDSADWLMGFVGTALVRKSVVSDAFFASIAASEQSTFVSTSALPGLLDELTWAPAREVFSSL